jgi:hypothetical protein
MGLMEADEKTNRAESGENKQQEEKRGVAETAEREAVPAGPERKRKHREDSGKSLRKIFRRGEQFIEELLSENERLRMRVMHLESEIQQAQKQVPKAVTVKDLQEVLERLRKENDDLRRRYKEIINETQRHKERYTQIENENEKLVNLFVASYQLHSTLDFDTTVQVIIEILLNFVGAGQFAIFMRDGQNERFHPLAAYGVSLEQLTALTAETHAIARCQQDAKPYIEEKPFQSNTVNQKNPLACIPLKLRGTIVGVVTIYSFLQQKTDVSQIDMELFKLLSDHGASVLISAQLFAEAENRIPTIEAYRSLLAHES